MTSPLSAGAVASGPAPGPESDGAFFWEAAAQRRLVVQRCSACGELRHPPQPMCPHCGSPQWAEQELSGRGTIYSYTVVHRPAVPGFDMPVVAVLVALAEGPRIVSRLVGAEPDSVRIGQEVSVTFTARGGRVLPEFRRVSAEAGES